MKQLIKPIKALYKHMQPDIKQLGLLPLPIDLRDFSHHAIYDTLGTTQIPPIDFSIYDSFNYYILRGDTLSAIAYKFNTSLVSILLANPQIKDKNKIYVGQRVTIPARSYEVKNQFDLDFCSAYASTEADEAIYGDTFDPNYRMAKTKQIRGEWQAYGANLRDAMQAATSYGSLPKKLSPFVHNFPNSGSPAEKDRNFLANWNNWPAELDHIAAAHRDGSFFKVDGPGDAFDNIRSTLWLHRQERRGVFFGLYWKGDWVVTLGGIIKDSGYTDPAFNGNAHAILIVGQKMIEGVPYLVIQNSWGPSLGDHGFFYFPRSVINKEYRTGFGAYTITKLSPGSAEWYLQNGITLGDNWINQLCKILITFFGGFKSK